MPAPRKVFRIEENVAARAPHAAVAPALDYHSDHLAEIMEALAALRANFAAPALPASPAAAEAAPALSAAQLSRIGDELQAVVAGTANATQKILNAAEEIDQLAHNLAATLKGKIEQDAAQDISDLVIRIFEACNFQDLTGQHVAKVMSRLKAIEEDTKESAKHDEPQITPAAAQFLHGPKLDNDSGHISQAEIDALFDS